MERIIKYSREWEEGSYEDSLSTFLYQLPVLTSCNIFPPLHILNILLCRGWAGGSMSPRFIWEPFEISEQEYQEVLPKILSPDWETLCKKLWRIRHPMKVDSKFDHIVDRDIWMLSVSQDQEYASKSIEEAEEKARKFVEGEYPDIKKKWLQYQTPQTLQVSKLFGWFTG